MIAAFEMGNLSASFKERPFWSSLGAIQGLVLIIKRYRKGSFVLAWCICTRNVAMQVKD